MVERKGQSVVNITRSQLITKYTKQKGPGRARHSPQLKPPNETQKIKPPNEKEEFKKICRNFIQQIITLNETPQ